MSNTKKIKADSLCGVVETNEIEFLRSNKGERNLDRPARKRGTTRTKDKDLDDYVSFLIGRDRNKFTFDKIIEKMSTSELHSALDDLLDSDVLLCCDNKKIFKEFAREKSLRHGFVNISKGEFVKKNVVHIQNIRNYCLQMTQWMERFHGVATKYLENYVSWFRGFDEFGDMLSPKLLLHRAKYGDASCYLPRTRT